MIKRDITDLTIIIVLYKQHLENSFTYTSLTAALTAFNGSIDLIVYDNSPPSWEPAKITENEHWNITYIRDTSNAGVSKAYNAGVKQAAGKGRKWALFTDQDTIFPPETIDTYINAIQTIKGVGVFVPKLVFNNKIVSPGKYFLKRGFAIPQIENGLHSFKGMCPINSGACISIELFNQVKGYDERIKLDFSDFDFFERLRKIEPHFYVLDIYCKHGISAFEISSKEQSLIRFGYYIEGARFFAKNYIDKLILLVGLSVRTIRLTFRYRSFEFLKILTGRFL